LILYTAITANKDTVRNCNFDIEKVLFTDTDLTSSTWEVKKISSDEENAVRRAKVYKVCPHLFFNDDTFWIDGNVELKMTPSFFMKILLEKDKDMILFNHPQRTSSFVEAEAVIKGGLDNREIVEKQVQRYKDEGFDGEGLSWGGFIVRRNNEKVKEFNECWWQEIKKGSVRDQISLPYAVWKTKIKVEYLQITEANFGDNDYYTKGNHNW